MTLSTEALTVLLVLLPGFVCAKLIQWLCPRPQQTEIEKIVDALLYSFIVYAVFVLIYGGFQGFNRQRVVVLAAIPFVLALIVSFLITNDSLGWILRTCKYHSSNDPAFRLA